MNRRQPEPPPARCACTSPLAATLDGTLRCPLSWWELPDGSWAHMPGWAR